MGNNATTLHHDVMFRCQTDAAGCPSGSPLSADGAGVSHGCHTKDATRVSGCAANTTASAAEGAGAAFLLEGGVAWLLAAISQEKAEKAWLASKYEWLEARYDERCAEVKMLTEELGAARSDLQLAQSMINQSRASADRSCSPAACIVRGAMSMSSASTRPRDEIKGQQVERNDTNAGTCLVKEQENASRDIGGVPQATGTPTGSLCARRHLNLGCITTVSQPERAKNDPTSCITTTGSKPERAKSDSTTLVRKKSGDSDAGLGVDSKFSDREEVEPTSGLLKRRAAADQKLHLGNIITAKSKDVSELEPVAVSEEVPVVARAARPCRTIGGIKTSSVPPEPMSALLRRRQNWSVNPADLLPEAVPTTKVARQLSAKEDSAKEPMSALLKRRAEDWTPLGQAAPTADKRRDGHIQVVPSKVANLADEDEDVPCSPKRRGRKSVF